jgi:hypothetical protein
MDHEITSSWNTTGNHWISVNYTDNHGCTSLQPTIFPVQVVPSPSPVITGPASSCTSSPSVTYQTEPGHENYFWIVTSGGQILSGGTPSDHFVTIKWNQAGSQEVSVNYEQYGCFGANAGLMQVLVFMPPSPVIYGNSNQLGCQGTISTYSTQSGMSGYLWMVSPGGSIVSGGTPGSSAIGIQWNSTGPQWLSVNYSNTQGCSAAQPFIANLNVIPRPVPSITGPANPGTGVPCQYATEPGMTNYTWTVSPGGVISGSTNSNMITVSWTATGSGYVKVNYFNAAYCNAITPSSLQINVIPASIALQNVNIAIGQNRCYEASQIITIAGGGTSFHVETGGNATMVAGQKVVYKTGTKVFPGGYMHGYISQDGLYCQALPAMVAKDDETPETHPTVSDSPVARFKVFPNPAVEEITILPSGSIQEGISMVEIIDIHGHELLSVFPRGKTQLTLNLPDLPPGIYLLRIRSAAYCEIIKLVIRNT